MMPRLACGPPSSGLVLASASRPRSATSAWPSCSASSAASNARNDSCESSAGSTAPPVAPVAPAAPGRSGALAAPLFCGSVAGAGRAGALGVPALTASSCVAQAPSARLSAIPRRSAYRIDRVLAALDLAVAQGAQRRKRLETAFYPLVVDALGTMVRIGLMQCDGLLLEGKSLLLEHHIVLLYFVLGQAFGPLRRHERLAKFTVELGGMKGGIGCHVRHAVGGRNGIRLEHVLQLCLLELELLLERLHQRDLAVIL